MTTHTVLVTGASRGIGAAIALKFAKEGCDLVITCSRDFNGLTGVHDRITALGRRCHMYIGDMGDYSVVESMFAELAAIGMMPDILVNNAGISMVGLFQDMTGDEWQHILNTNLTSVYNCCHFALPSMIQGKNGCIINISSVWGNVGASCEVAYSATKGAINALTKALAKELAPSCITVNAIACGAIDTSMNGFLSSEDRQALIEEIPAGRMGEPEEVANLAYMLANSGTYLTGQIVTLDGGWI